MLALINTPVKPHHQALLEAAAAGRCRLEYDRTHLAEADILIGDFPPEDLFLAPRLRWFQLVWAGADRYVKNPFPEGVRFTNCSGAYGVPIAEHMMAGLLALVRQLRHYDRLQTDRVWDQAWQEDTLEGKTVLILGTGDIGTALAKRLRGFDCRIVGVRRTAAPQPEFDEIHPLSDLDALLPQADVVAGCLPGTPLTEGLLDEARLRAMKKTALLLNCGRGSLIVTGDLEQVLLSGHLGGCLLDVTDPEPLPPESPLWTMDHVILTPHISGASFGHVDRMEDRIYEICADNLARFLDGRPLRNLVSFQTGYRFR